MKAQLLGPVRAWQPDGSEIALGSAHRRAVFAVLALRANTVVPRAELIDAIWGESAPASASGSIYTYVSGLRQALEPGRSRRSAGTVLVSEGSGYRLRLEPEALDVSRFVALREQSRDADTARRRENLDAALTLWQGEALDGTPGPFAAAQRDRLTEMWLDTKELRAQVALDAGEHATVLTDLFDLVARHPLREGLRGLLMTALWRAGRRTDALGVYTDFHTTTVAKLGVEPSTALTHLYDQMLAGTAPDEAPSFVGRDAELSVLRAAAEAVSAGRGGSVWVDGEPGIGKSALLAEGLSGTGGIPVASAVADELGQRFPLRFLLDGLGVSLQSDDPRRVKLAERVRDLAESGAEAITEAVDDVLDLVERLCEDGPLVLVGDEMQWADPASLLVWERLAGETGRLPLLLAGACRPLPRRPEVERLRATLSSTTARISLGPLDDDAVHGILVESLGAEPGADLLASSALAAGNPRYVKEIAENFAGGQSPVFPAAQYLTFLTEDTREVLRLAALLGDGFTVTELEAALGDREIDTTAAVLEALVGGVLTSPDDRLEFRHPVVRRALYDHTPAGVRVALHRQFADAMARFGCRADRVAEQLLAAGAPVEPWVLDWVPAEIGALATRTPQSALRLLRLAAGSAAAGVEERDALTTVETRLRFWLGGEPMAEAASAAARTTDPGRAAELRWIVAYLHYRRGDIPAAITGVQDALRDPAMPSSWRQHHESLLSLVMPAGSLLATFLPAQQAASDAGLDRALEVVSVVPKLATLHRLLLDDMMPTLRAVTDDDLSCGRTARAYWHGSWDSVLTELGNVVHDGAAVASYLLGPPGSVRLLHSVAGLIAGHRGEVGTAKAHLLAAQEQPRLGTADFEGADFLLVANAVVAEQLGHAEEALDLLSASFEKRFQPTRYRHHWLPVLVRLAQETGDRARARYATMLCETTPGPEAAHCRGLLEHDSARVLTAAGHYLGQGAPLSFATAMEDAAVLMAERDDHEGAEAAFRKALRAYTRLGARWDARRAETRLRPFGMTPPAVTSIATVAATGTDG
ncbi:BTAD domain-containing putative transcriptional regulator [Amycolatopsis minnesotensis]|uniref:BTAD domain-containing putative transcriptional regulator n=1 Tax=Amycolatopsis minnesotensis TaxID=337894 RepID=A0ABP5DKK5_9PSEU